MTVACGGLSLPHQRAVSFGRKGHLFFCIKAGPGDEAMGLWDFTCPEGLSFPILHGDALQASKVFDWTLFSFSLSSHFKFPVISQGDLNLETEVTSFTFILTSLPNQLVSSFCEKAPYKCICYHRRGLCSCGRNGKQ